jgi:hypothetical protein
MSTAYQGGPSVEVLSTQGKKAESAYKAFGSVKKVLPAAAGLRAAASAATPVVRRTPAQP